LVGDILTVREAAQGTGKPFVDHGGTVFRRHGSLQTCRGGPALAAERVSTVDVGWLVTVRALLADVEPLLAGSPP